MIINSLNEDNKELSNQLHSLRMAVLEYINEGIKEYGDHFLISERFGYFRKLALSAGIEFKDGWRLKEGE